MSCVLWLLKENWKYVGGGAVEVKMLTDNLNIDIDSMQDQYYL